MGTTFRMVVPRKGPAWAPVCLEPTRIPCPRIPLANGIRAWDSLVEERVKERVEERVEVRV